MRSTVFAITHLGTQKIVMMSPRLFESFFRSVLSTIGHLRTIAPIVTALLVRAVSLVGIIIRAVFLLIVLTILLII